MAAPYAERRCIERRYECTGTATGQIDAAIGV
jgi:hypothetical protein